MRKRFTLVLACFLMGCQQNIPNSMYTISLVSPAGETHTFFTEIADANEERQQGLMHREHLPEDHAMLFVFEAEQPLDFWMKNTLIPLDIFYFDEDGEFVSMQSMVPCEADPCRTYPSSGNAKYAVEVVGGWGASHAVGTGWTLKR
jgi:uncharacterized protein